VGKAVGIAMRVTGGLLIAFGILWALQGAGVVNWPSTSPMLGRGVWVVNGLVTVAIGAVLLLIGLRTGRGPRG
jgi:hypothetical protein